MLNHRSIAAHWRTVAKYDFYFFGGNNWISQQVVKYVVLLMTITCEPLK